MNMPNDYDDWKTDPEYGKRLMRQDRDPDDARDDQQDRDDRDDAGDES